MGRVFHWKRKIWLEIGWHIKKLPLNLGYILYRKETREGERYVRFICNEDYSPRIFGTFAQIYSTLDSRKTKTNYYCL